MDGFSEGITGTLQIAKQHLGHKVKTIFDSISSMSQNMLRHAYNKIKTNGFLGILSEPREDYEDSLDEFLFHINEGRVPTNYFAYEGLGTFLNQISS